MNTTSTHESLESISEAIIEVAKTVNATKAILFGSFARGTETRHSDIDVVMIKDTAERFVERPQQVLSLLYDKIHGRAIDVLIYTPSEFERMSSSGNKFMQRVLREGKIIYGN
ncbi:MAG: nucleotidyltransferase domain-containing protein [Ignavibacteriae bacterium]|nr:nucleotidyltransferase domain-containing protein [Ignavibacteriota bacterium]